MALLKENINNLITDDLDKRNQNWTSIDESLGLKADKTYVDSQDALKADKTYVDSKVKTDVPSGAKFTDTVTTINGKTGTITKADITALGIPAQDTVYSHPSSHPASMIAESSTKRFVSDSEKSTWNSKSDTDTVTTINGKTGAISKADIVALGIPAQDTNTTYGVATSSTNGLMASADKSKLDGMAAGANNYVHPGSGTNPHGTTKEDVGLGNVDNIKQMPISGGVLENYREKLTTVSPSLGLIDLSLGNVFVHTPTGNRIYTILNAVNGQAHSFTLIINIGNYVRTLTFPASVKWQGGEIPDMSTANKTYLLTFMSVDGGTTWLGMFGGEF